MTDGRTVDPRAHQRADSPAPDDEASPEPETGWRDAGWAGPGAVRTSRSAAEVAALAASSDEQRIRPPAVSAPAPHATPAPGGARGDTRSYSERYGATPADPAVTSGRQVLRTRSAARRALSLLLLVSLGASGVLAYGSWRAPSSATLGIAAASGVLTLVVWAVRASTLPVRVVLDHGILEVDDRRGHHRFDLTTNHTPVEMVGEPGRRGWEVRFGRDTGRPLVLTAKDVDPRRLTELLRQWRPRL